MILSVHPHNDRGTAVAAAELAIMAGADRVEGTLFGNGERTGNVDVVTLALNLYSQGVDPGLDLSNVPEIVRTVEECNRLPVHQRHPVRRRARVHRVLGLAPGRDQERLRRARRRADGARWEVPYLAVDPKDIGRTYDAVVRVNSQSGKGGVAYVLENEHGLRRCRAACRSTSAASSSRSPKRRAARSAPRRFAPRSRRRTCCRGALRLAEYATTNDGVAGTPCTIDAALTDGVVQRTIYGDGTGPIDAFVDALQRAFAIDVHVKDYYEHALRAGEDASAVAYVEVAVDGESRWGVGIDPNIVTASLTAIVGAVAHTVRSIEAPRKESPHEAIAV